jgi:hypothetical protein
VAGSQSLGIIRERLASALGVTDDEAVAISSRIIPVILAAEITQPESADVFNERLCIGTGSVAAKAAEYSMVQLWNAADSGVNAHVTQMSALTSANSFQVRHHAAAIGTADGNIAFRDRRLNGQPAAHVRRFDDAGLLGTIMLGSSITQGDVFPLDVILPPGTGIIVNCDAVNVTLYAHFWWTELRAA